MMRNLALGEALPDVLERAAKHAPYLRRLLARASEQTLTQIHASDADRWINAAHAQLGSLAEDAPLDDIKSKLRCAKNDVHLAIAAGDLSDQFSQPRVTVEITKFADAAVQVALDAALRGRGLSGDGLFIIALGKMGAHMS